MSLLTQLALRPGGLLASTFLKSAVTACTNFHSSATCDAEYVRMRRVQRLQRLGAKPSEKWKPLRGRKPLFVPPAKTKFFRVPKLPTYPQDEQELLRKWAIAYEASLDGLYTLFRFDEETNEARRASSIREDNPLSSAELRDAIEEFNRQSQRHRAEVLPSWLATAKQEISDKRKSFDEADFRELMRIEKRLQTDLAEADRFIDASNLRSVDLDAFVRNVVDAPPVSFEFPIDQRGERADEQRAARTSQAAPAVTSQASSGGSSAKSTSSDPPVSAPPASN